MNQKYEAALILCQYGLFKSDIKMFKILGEQLVVLVVLRYESENETAREFYPLIIEKIHRGKCMTSTVHYDMSVSCSCMKSDMVDM